MLKQEETVLKKLKIVECNIKMNAKIVLNHSIYLIIIVTLLFKIVRFQSLNKLVNSVKKIMLWQKILATALKKFQIVLIKKVMNAWNVKQII